MITVKLDNLAVLLPTQSTLSILEIPCRSYTTVAAACCQHTTLAPEVSASAITGWKVYSEVPLQIFLPRPVKEHFPWWPSQENVAIGTKKPSAIIGVNSVVGYLPEKTSKTWV